MSGESSTSRTTIPQSSSTTVTAIEPNENSPLLMDSATPPSSPKRLQSNNDDTVLAIESSSSDDKVESRRSRSPRHLDTVLPAEMHKTVIGALVLAGCFFLNTLSLVLTHQRQPDRNTTKPLPDLVMDNLPFPVFDDGLYIAEVMIMVSTISSIAVMTLHRFRWIIFRRIFFIMSILYFLRAITMYVTVFPEASYTYYCSPKFSPATALDVLLGTFKVLSGFGLSINGEHTYCGDYMYSGHTVILVTAALIIQEYSPRSSWHWKVVHGFYWIMAIIGILLVLSARGHYTIDILVAYYITTRLWWIYHTLANNRDFRRAEGNFINRVWWFRAFEWMEGNVKRNIPYHYSIPLPCYPSYVDFEARPVTVVRMLELPR